MSEPIDPQPTTPSRPDPDLVASDSDPAADADPRPENAPLAAPAARPPFLIGNIHLAANRLLLPDPPTHSTWVSPETDGKPAEVGESQNSPISPESGSLPAPRLIRVPVGCPPNVREDIESVISSLWSDAEHDFQPLEVGLGREHFEQALAQRRWEMEEWEDWEDGEGPETIGVDGAPFHWGYPDWITLVEENHPLYPFAPYVIGIFFGGFGGVFSWYCPDGTVFACVLEGFGTPVPTFDPETGWSVVLEIDEYGKACSNGMVYAPDEAVEVLTGALKPDVPELPGN